MSADDLDRAASIVEDVLAAAVDRDWRAATGTGELNARDTAEHLGDCLLSYAAQLIATPPGRYVRFLAVADKDASAAEVLEFAVTGARILSSVVRTSPPTTRAHHPTGLADPAGFAAMGCVEVLVHGLDIARGLGLDLIAPADLCEPVVARMFPHTPAPDLDPWTHLLWATDRIAVPGRPAQTGWRWRGAPLDEDA
ncbi:hypothetical protein BN6_34690 [Saccharothrix espanaensis DSM 44229]|uniref:Mycothiol-dependent maleylpyruvate isomerase metal-binding domain-containing protein n=1 Tax=Saccharothrix espanaensis (strain ATCC 51144 / DSM 44229 / JCM 9112 / NBRC 15066 / NRRL 15764) TaxID=1179773 RepID=K0JZP0_SACES|nr:hypothetical protein BN6_34690 [Saccharothrix espanaensis DSM 44229]